MRPQHTGDQRWSPSRRAVTRNWSTDDTDDPTPGDRRR